MANIFAMPSASAIRLQIETALAHRIPSALTPAQKLIRPVAQTNAFVRNHCAARLLRMSAAADFQVMRRLR